MNVLVDKITNNSVRHELFINTMLNLISYLVTGSNSLFFSLFEL